MQVIKMCWQIANIFLKLLIHELADDEDLLTKKSDAKKNIRPFSGRAVVASAFSPRALALLNEAQQLLACLGMTPIIVHVGERSPKNIATMEKIISESQFASMPNVKLELQDGDPEEVLLHVARSRRADLIIAGALPREGRLKFYWGSVGRNLARLAPCSVLLHAKPEEMPPGWNKIHHAVEYQRGWDVGVDLSARLTIMTGARELYFTHAFHIPESVLKKKKTLTAEDYKKIYGRQDHRLQKYLSMQLAWQVPYHTQSLYEKDQFPSLAFTREIRADLFVINAPKKKPGLWDRLFPNDLEQILYDLPCSILIARKTDSINKKTA